ncbi:HK97 family phage prohead protease [uncultured Brachyspira sp.]|uniref:HK97 family phage prohead protease n=1 Tax=uncultured Brachyspira sp. TaxID=221953 RepID=UPI002585F3DD|nr:HK97 family phage prohead protease [uncultured Brachyspira sp.]
MSENNKNEIRHINIDISHIEKREDSPDKLSGYAIVFNALSEPFYGLFRERVVAGALEKTLREDDQRCLWGHDSMYVLGRKSAGTLLLREDDKGLYFEVTPPNTGWAKDLVESVHRGDINQMSFGFRVYDERWIQDEKTIEEYGMSIREILGMQLEEISIVTFPAYPDTSVRNKDVSEYIPKPPTLNDGFEERSILYDKSIKVLKIKNN